MIFVEKFLLGPKKSLFLKGPKKDFRKKNILKNFTFCVQFWDIYLKIVIHFGSFLGHFCDKKKSWASRSGFCSLVSCLVLILQFLVVNTTATSELFVLWDRNNLCFKIVLKHIFQCFFYWLKLFWNAKQPQKKGKYQQKNLNQKAIVTIVGEGGLTGYGRRPYL